MDIFTGYKKRLKLQSDHEAELRQFEEDHKEVVRILLKDYKADIESIEKEKDAIKGVYTRDLKNMRWKLDQAKGELNAMLTEKDRMEKLLTKINKRAGIYRTMIEARDAWEAEINLQKEEDKIEDFIKWKNNRGE